MPNNYDSLIKMEPKELADFIYCPHGATENLNELLSHCIFNDAEYPPKRDCHQCKLNFLLSKI